MKNDLTTGAWQRNIGCPIKIVLVSTSHVSLLILKTLQRRPQPTPSAEAPGGGVCSANKNHAAGGANGSIMVGMFVCLCFASQQPSEWEFFVPAGKDLAVNSLRAMNGRDHPLLN